MALKSRRPTAYARKTSSDVTVNSSPRLTDLWSHNSRLVHEPPGGPSRELFEVNDLVGHLEWSQRSSNTGDQLQSPTQDDGAAAANMNAVPSYKKRRRALSAASPRSTAPSTLVLRPF
jgi:hypothetical protein